MDQPAPKISAGQMTPITAQPADSRGHRPHPVSGDRVLPLSPFSLCRTPAISTFHVLD